MNWRGSVQGDLKIVAVQIFPFGGAEQGEVGCGKVQIFVTYFDSGMHHLSLSLSSL